jgi:hypothetical protein
MKDKGMEISKNPSHAKGFFEKPFPEKTQRSLPISSKGVLAIKVASF